MKPILFFILFFFSLNLYGQQNSGKQNSARFGSSFAFFGAGDLYGISIYGEYVCRLSKVLSVSPRIMSGFASRADFDHLSSFAGSVSLGINPFPRKSFKIDVGGLYHKVINSYGSLGDMQYGQSEIISGYHSNENLLGFIGSLSGNLYSNKKMELGARFDLLTSLTEGYLNADSWQIGLYIGLKH